MIKDIFLIQVIVNVNAINLAVLDYSNCKCRKKLYDKLIDKCAENIDVVMIDDEKKINVVFLWYTLCALCYFLYFLL